MLLTDSEWLNRMAEEGRARPALLQGVYPFLGQGLQNPFTLSEELVYTVPPGRQAALIYFRAGNASDQLIYLSIAGNGLIRRYFPIGPQAHSHVSLAIREPISAGTRLEAMLASASGVYGTVIIDAGFIEWEEGEL